MKRPPVVVRHPPKRKQPGRDNESCGVSSSIEKAITVPVGIPGPSAPHAPTNVDGATTATASVDDAEFVGGATSSLAPAEHADSAKVAATKAAATLMKPIPALRMIPPDVRATLTTGCGTEVSVLASERSPEDRNPEGSDLRHVGAVPNCSPPGEDLSDLRHVGEPAVVAQERHGDGLGGTVAVLGHDQVGLARSLIVVVEILTVNQNHDVGVLLDRS